MVVCLCAIAFAPATAAAAAAFVAVWSVGVHLFVDVVGCFVERFGFEIQGAVFTCINVSSFGHSHTSGVIVYL